MTSPTHVVLRVLQSVSSIIVLGISAYRKPSLKYYLSKVDTVSSHPFTQADTKPWDLASSVYRNRHTPICIIAGPVRSVLPWVDTLLHKERQFSYRIPKCSFILWHTLAINQYVIFLAQASISGFYFGTFIAMAVSVSKIQHCSGLMCSALRADVVFAALSYFFWITSTTIHAIQMARGDRKHRKIAAAKEEMENATA